jgi:hypothetical protein
MEGVNMNKGTGIQNSMFMDIKEKTIFRKAQNYAYEYIENAL